MTDRIPIEVVPYDPRWPALFDEASREIAALIGDYIVAIDHIGSTAVPGLAAKPVIDLLISVRSLVDAPRFLPPLVSLGYTYVPKHEVAIPERRYLHRIAGGKHTHHLHIVEPGSEFYRLQLLFRDYLRAHPTAVEEYAVLKYQLAAQFQHEREAYTDGKSAFIEKILYLAQHHHDQA